MICLEDALAIVEQTLAGVALPTETVASTGALGRTLAGDQASRLDLPPFDKSAMDGYALLADDRRETYRVLETVAAGMAPRVRLTPGTAVKVMTGAPVPEATGRVVKIEDVDLDGQRITVRKHDSETNFCRQGEDVRRGEVVLPAGTRLSPLDIANLIGCGITEVRVFRPVRLAILSTGDEIAQDPAALGPGMIMDTNGPLLDCLARQHCLEVVDRQWVRDDRAATAGAIRRALERADMVVISGGVSVGDFDYVTRAMEDAGLQVRFTAVAIKPGRPTTYASAAGKAVFGLPGNPVSVFLMFHLFVLWTASRLTGAPRRSAS